MDTFKSTWKSINEFARAHTEGEKMEEDLQSNMSEMMSQMAQDGQGDNACMCFY